MGTWQKQGKPGFHKQGGFLGPDLKIAEESAICSVFSRILSLALLTIDFSGRPFLA